jgi:hypothetical protein
MVRGLRIEALHGGKTVHVKAAWRRFPKKEPSRHSASSCKVTHRAPLGPSSSQKGCESYCNMKMNAWLSSKLSKSLNSPKCLPQIQSTYESTPPGYIDGGKHKLATGDYRSSAPVLHAMQSLRQIICMRVQSARTSTRGNWTKILRIEKRYCFFFGVLRITDYLFRIARRARSNP